ncbi:hypothetical protein LIER_11722 [Lithospermum erythrorhizon]|uniref:Uncharacterized protein n=1 Tax=Lithospermum erythrorhizon TaxID=34254 RepID=A0AAV3PP26_LITER
MTVGVPRLWTLQEEARNLPIDIAADLAIVAKIQSILPQGENMLPWNAFMDKAALVKAGLVYDKDFNPEAPGDPSSWEEIISYTDTEKAPADVDFDDMVSDRPPLFSRVAITTKTKPRASMVPESTSTTPLATGSNPPPTTIPLVKIP